MEGEKSISDLSGEIGEVRVDLSKIFKILEKHSEMLRDHSEVLSRLTLKAIEHDVWFDRLTKRDEFQEFKSYQAGVNDTLTKCFNRLDGERLVHYEWLKRHDTDIAVLKQ